MGVPPLSFNGYCEGAKGLFTWREEDPRRRNNFSLGLNAETVTFRVVPK